MLHGASCSPLPQTTACHPPADTQSPPCSQCASWCCGVCHPQRRAQPELTQVRAQGSQHSFSAVHQFSSALSFCPVAHLRQSPEEYERSSCYRSISPSSCHTDLILFGVTAPPRTGSHRTNSTDCLCIPYIC